VAFRDEPDDGRLRQPCQYPLRVSPELCSECRALCSTCTIRSGPFAAFGVAHPRSVTTRPGVHAEPCVRRVITMADAAIVLLNDLYSMAEEQKSANLDFNPSTVIVA
jgi:hypothetical protein